MDKWEYHTLHAKDTSDAASCLPRLGAEGWELVAVTQNPQVGYWPGTVSYIFKRKVQ